jgi:hypothetical protein
MTGISSEYFQTRTARAARARARRVHPAPPLCRYRAYRRGRFCFNREGHVLADCTLGLFRTLKRRGLIASSGGGPYRVTRLGLISVRSQLDNR